MMMMMMMMMAGHGGCSQRTHHNYDEFNTTLSSLEIVERFSRYATLSIQRIVFLVKV